MPESILLVAVAVMMTVSRSRYPAVHPLLLFAEPIQTSIVSSYVYTNNNLFVCLSRCLSLCSSMTSPILFLFGMLLDSTFVRYLSKQDFVIVKLELVSGDQVLTIYLVRQF